MKGGSPKTAPKYLEPGSKHGSTGGHIMTKTTSLELSKKLYEAFPEWDDCHYKHIKGYNGGWMLTSSDAGWLKGHIEQGGEFDLKDWCPAPDLEYILDKFPTYEINNNGIIASIEIYNPKNETFITESGKRSDLVETAGRMALRLKEAGVL